ncbi:MAG: DUF1178 family protein [Burkholderiales bacterium]|nr:DUF1178 family protein [Burkholderiales bacterium]
MIVFELGCDNDHRFEGWFASGGDFERQLNDKLLTCPVCGSTGIARLPHASYVNTGSGAGTGKAGSAQSGKGKVPAQRQYANLGGEMLAKLVEHIIENTEDVGAAFPEEARKIHYQETPERHIRGTASTKEVEELKEEGIEVVAVPIPPHRAGKTH